jgi:hypothetical protein
VLQVGFNDLVFEPRGKAYPAEEDNDLDPVGGGGSWGWKQLLQLMLCFMIDLGGVQKCYVCLRQGCKLYDLTKGPVLCQSCWLPFQCSSERGCRESKQHLQLHISKI